MVYVSQNKDKTVHKSFKDIKIEEKVVAVVYTKSTTYLPTYLPR